MAEINIVRPQVPLKKDDTYLYPLTSADQVVLTDGSRLEGNLITIDLTGSPSDDAVVSINADQLGGHPASYFASRSTVSSYMPKSGGTFTGNVTATTTNRTSLGLYNMSVFASNQSTMVSTNRIKLIRK